MTTFDVLLDQTLSCKSFQDSMFIPLCSDHWSRFTLLLIIWDLVGGVKRFVFFLMDDGSEVLWNSLGDRGTPPWEPRPRYTNVCAKIQMQNRTSAGEVDCRSPGFGPKGQMWGVLIETFYSASPETFWSLSLLTCLSYVTCFNQQSELRPLISFMKAPSLISLSVYLPQVWHMMKRTFRLKVCVSVKQCVMSTLATCPGRKG